MKFFTLLLFCYLVFSAPAFADQADLFKDMQALANTGDAEAQYHVGMMYNNGIGTQKDSKQAFEWFQKSASSHDPLGAYKLGCYYDGQGEGVVKHDANEALKFKLIAAKAGYSFAQHDVANYYGRQGNFEEAVKWWKMAADQGYPLALYNLSNMYLEGMGVTKDISQAYAYFKLSKLVSEKKVNPNAQATLDELAARMSKAELEKAERIVTDWKPKPTDLTLKAKRGLKAAEEHVQSTKKS